MKRIVVGVDGSAHANRAVDVAARLAADAGAEMTLIAVLTLPYVLDAEDEAYAEIERISLQEVKEMYVDPRPPFLFRARERAAISGLRFIETVATVGDPAEELVKTADRRQADLIVVGRRGRGQIASLVFGSVSLKTLQHATCPVMIVP